MFWRKVVNNDKLYWKLMMKYNTLKRRLRHTLGKYTRGDFVEYIAVRNGGRPSPAQGFGEIVRITNRNTYFVTDICPCARIGWTYELNKNEITSLHKQYNTIMFDYLCESAAALEEYMDKLRYEEWCEYKDADGKCSCQSGECDLELDGKDVANITKKILL